MVMYFFFLKTRHSKTRQLLDDRKIDRLVLVLNVLVLCLIDSSRFNILLSIFLMNLECF